MPHSTMKAALCHRYGSADVIRITRIKKPVPGDREILIRIKATAVNSADVRVRGLAVNGVLRWIMRLVLGFTGPRKPVLGTVLAGVVEEAGKKVQLFKPGDEVFAMSGFKFGAHAEYIALNEKAVIGLKPEKASFEESAAILFGGSTTIHFLCKKDPGILSGKHVLIYGASGAVGTSAIQIARYCDAQVTAVCSKAGLELAQRLGATTCIDYTQEDFTQAGHRYDIIFDAVGKLAKNQCRHCLVQGGKFITVGGLEVASESQSQLQMLRRLFDNGHLDAVIDKRFSLDDIADAHRYVDTGKKKGNVVIAV